MSRQHFLRRTQTILPAHLPSRTDLSESYKGLRIAKGDQLVDVLHIWNYRVRKDSDRKDYDRILGYSLNLVPEIVAIVEDGETDVELRDLSG